MSTPANAAAERRERVGEGDHETGVDAHQPRGVTVVRSGDDGLAVDRLAVEEVRRPSIIAIAPPTTSISIGSTFAPKRVIGDSGSGPGKRRSSLPPNVFRDVLEDDAERDRRHDPAEFRLDLDGRTHTDPLDDGALQEAEDADDGNHQPVVDAHVHEREADHRAEHQRLALAEVQRSRGRERELVTERDDRVDHPQRDAAVDQLQQDHRSLPVDIVGAPFDRKRAAPGSVGAALRMRASRKSRTG